MTQTPASPPPAPTLPALIAITPQTLWQVAGITLGIVFVLFVFINASAIMLLIFTAIILAEAMRPIVRWLGRFRIPRPLAILGIYLVVFGILGLFLWLLATPLLAQFTTFINNAPGYATQLQHLLAKVQSTLGSDPTLASAWHSIENQAGSFLGLLLVGIISLPLNAFTVFFSIIVVLTMAFFWLNSMDNADSFFLDLVPEANRATVTLALDALSHRLGGFVRGILFNMGVIGLLTGLGIWLLGVPYALLLGIFAGLTEVIPYIGTYLGAAAAVTVAIVTVDQVKGVEVLAMYVIIQELEGNLLVPVVMHRAVKLNPFLVIAAVLTGGALFGFAGSVLAVPMAVVIAILVEYLVAPAVRHHTKADIVLAPPSTSETTAMPSSVAQPVPTVPA